MKTLRTLLAAGGLAILAAAPAVAHHSFGMFALDKLTTVTGTVTEYNFHMPHVWIYLDVADAKGQVQKWGFEAHSPNIVARKGWSIKTMKPGDKVTILMHPMKDGSHAGSVVHATLADGRQLWNSESLTKP